MSLRITAGHSPLAGPTALAHPVVEEDERLQDIIEAGTNLGRCQRVQCCLQGPHMLGEQPYTIGLYGAGQETQQAWVPQGLQVLRAGGVEWDEPGSPCTHPKKAPAT